MTTPEALEMPKGKNLPPKKHFLPVILFFGAVLLLALLFWLWPRSIESRYALLDGTVYTVTAEYSAPLLAFEVEEGAKVREGDVVARLDARSFNAENRDAAREIANLRTPDMVMIAGRLKEAQEAEEDAVLRLATVRHEEESRGRLVDQAVMRHVKAQLAMRSLQAEGVGGSSYAKAREQEQKARKEMERAKEELERASLVRARVNRELQQLRKEVQLVRARAGGNFSRTEQTPHADGLLKSPMDGTVLVKSAKVGEEVSRGDPLLIILPSGSRQSFWVTAWFPKEEGDRLKTGLSCRVERKTGEVLSGTVTQINGPSPLPEGDDGGEYISLRVGLEGNDLTPGEEVRCIVRSAFF
ncbi:MAG: HlyD family efflux transporter periplasmic adaptor subunit [Desulfovibrio sp.]|nr:HlyD family efflux transporter periplasmic adaptor subunit [Desulfovibrio sp.]